jgi:hypothetical protein
MMRLSPEQWDAMQKKHAIPVLKEPKPTKYRSRAVGGYASTKEARRAAALKQMELAGLIRDLREQVKYTLIDTQVDEFGKLLERACVYYADFVYDEKQKNGGWELRVEDVKGLKKGAAYANFVIKRKLMLHRYGTRIREV